MHAERARRFVTDAPTSAAEAAEIILDGVRADRLRILIGPAAHIVDRMVRQDPDHAYVWRLALIRGRARTHRPEPARAC
jgi:hypothetical protein